MKQRQSIMGELKCDMAAFDSVIKLFSRKLRLNRKRESKLLPSERKCQNIFCYRMQVYVRVLSSQVTWHRNVDYLSNDIYPFCIWALFKFYQNTFIQIHLYIYSYKISVHVINWLCSKRYFISIYKIEST